MSDQNPNSHVVREARLQRASVRRRGETSRLNIANKRIELLKLFRQQDRRSRLYSANSLALATRSTNSLR